MAGRRGTVGRVDRIEIERTLSETRAWLLETYAALPESDLHRPATASEHDPENWWTPLDHLAHLALIERNFVAMVRRHVAGDANPVGLANDAGGRTRTRAEVMAYVHNLTEEWQREHAGKTLSEVAALTAAARAETLRLLSELSDEQLADTLPGAPWADGTVGGVLAANANHGRTHYQWARAGLDAPR